MKLEKRLVMAAGIIISISNIYFFLPEYFIATALALLTFNLIDRIRKPKIVPVLPKNPTSDDWIILCCSFRSILSQSKSEILEFYAQELLSTGMSEKLVTPVSKRKTPIPAPILLKKESSFTASVYPRERLPDSEIYQEDNLFFIYRVAISVSVWGGSFLLITPFNYLRFFLPNFGLSVNVLIDVVLGVSIFESIITGIATKTGKNYLWILVTEFLVVLLVSSALFLPAMSWFRAEPLIPQLLIYLILIMLVSVITVLAFLIGKRRYTFVLSFVFASVAYAIFLSTTIINIITFVLARV
ncbi:MAG: hypothetical protein QW597_00480 [Thermoplasmataceae archaeon]